MKHIENVRDQFKPVAFRVSRLFFVLVQMMNVDPMYQYSLDFYKMIYERALDNGNSIEKGKRNEKVKFFIKEFTSLLYENICRSLFEEHKLLFSMLMLFKIVEKTVDDPSKILLDAREVRFMMVGGSRVEMARPNPTGEGGWMTDKMWAGWLPFCKYRKSLMSSRTLAATLRETLTSGRESITCNSHKRLRKPNGQLHMVTCLCLRLLCSFEYSDPIR